jgi:alpha-galactosidase
LQQDVTVPGEIEVRDADLGLTLRFCFAVVGGVISAQTVLISETSVTLHWLAAPVLPGPQLAEEIVDFAGRWVGEFQPTRTPWHPGAHLREARSGRSGHEHPPFALFPETGCRNTAGTVAAMHYGWSGGHRLLAEELPDGRRQIQWGHAAGTCGTGTRFETAPLLLARSDRGMNGTAVQFQRYFRDHLVCWPQPDRPRPVHYNCWEAIYFDHDLNTLKEIASCAADLGAERFVLDDGWFGRRDDDTSSLGDWQIDPRKWPEGFQPLIDHIHQLGMRFGLWFEPEMVNLDSELARAHPEWILGPAHQIEGRQQRVLDLSRPEVRECLFDQITAILNRYDIDYVKWDHNRQLPMPDAAQAYGVYTLMEQLRTAHPGVEFESCASGGGRIDAGILRYTQRVWLSDSNDARERQRIQHDAALFLPSAITGSHVGPRQCHTSGRILPMALRAWTAAARHMGFEMDPRELTEEEATILRTVTRWWKTNRVWMRDADILRLDHQDPALLAEQQISAEGDRFVVFASQIATSGQTNPRPLRLTGLEPQALYDVRLITVDDLPALARGMPALKRGAVVLTGQYLMSHGLTLPWDFPDTIRVIEGKRQ